MPSPSCDRNLLFGILALQLDFLTRDQLLAGMHAWVLEKTTPLGQLLRRQGALDDECCELTDALVNAHLKLHKGEARQSLASLSSAELVKKALGEVPDGDLQHSLACLGAAGESESGSDSANQTVVSLGQPISAGIRFRILRPHRKGGLGEVVVALDSELQREVALKKIQDQYADEADARSRFVREGEITGKLEHPGIVPVYGLGHYDNGRPFYAMRFVKGDSLEDAIKHYHATDNQPRLESERTLELRNLLGRFVDVCNAIAYAHSRSVLHRDLKPGNIMLGQFGETLVVDWGLAKAQGESEGPGVSDEERVTRSTGPIKISSGSGLTPTQAGSVLGTPAFMSPEQASGRLDELGPASDVYSLGATLYCLLTGKSPVHGEKGMARILERVCRGEIAPPRQVNPAVPPALEAVCRKAMAFEARARYTTARELAEEIERWLADEPVLAWPEPVSVKARRWVGKHRTLVSSAAAVLVVGAFSLAGGLVVVGGLNRQLDDNIRDLQDANTRLDVARNDAETRRIGEANARELAETRLREVERAALQMEFDHLYVRSAAAPGEALVGAAELLPRLQKVADKPLEDSVRLHLAAWAQRLQPLRAVLPHGGAVAFSPDGKTVLTGSSDKTARLWEAATGKPIGQAMQHEQEVWAVEFSPDGKTVLTGSRDKTARLWEAASGKPIGLAMHHQNEVQAVAFSPDGQTVLTGSNDKTARLWEATTGKPVGLPMQHQDKVVAVAFSPDGQTVLTGSHDKTAMLWEAATGKPNGLILQHQNRVVGVAFSPDGKKVLTGSHDKTARLWEAATGKPIGLPMQHQDIVFSVVFSPDGQKVLTGSSDKTARLWQAATGKPIGLVLHQAAVNHVTFSPDGKTVLTGSSDNTARLWEAATGKPFGLPLQHQYAVTRVAFSPDGKTVLTGTYKTAQLWEAASGKPIRQPMQHQDTVVAVAFSPDGKTVLTGSRDKTARLWETATGKPIGLAMQHPDKVEAMGISLRTWAPTVAFSPDGKTVLTRSNDKTAQMWEVATGKPVGLAMEHQNLIFAVAFSPDGKTVLTGSLDKTARLWQATTGIPIAQPLQHQGSVHAVAFSPDGKTVLTASTDRTARLWEAATGKPIGLAIQHQGPVTVAAFSPDGKTVLTGSSDKTARLWEAETGKPIGLAMQHQNWVFGVAFSPDGKTVLTGSRDKTARLWEAATGKPIGQVLQHQAEVQAVAFSPGGQTVLTGSTDKTARLWEAATGKLIGQALQHQSEVGAVAFSPDGKTALTGSVDRTARLWKVPQPIAGEPERIILWAQVITGMEPGEQGIFRVLDATTWETRRQALEKLGGPPEM